MSASGSLANGSIRYFGANNDIGFHSISTTSSGATAVQCQLYNGQAGSCTAGSLPSSVPLNWDLTLNFNPDELLNLNINTIGGPTP
jgi:hypothetical protein